MEGRKDITSRIAFLSVAGLLTSCAHAAGVDAKGRHAETQLDLESLHVYEPAPASTTRYRFDFECAKSPQTERYRVTIEGSIRDVPEPGRISSIERVSVDAHEMGPKDLAFVNQLIPSRSVQERPWIQCSKDGIEVAIRLPADATGSGPARFEMDAHAKLKEMADGE